MRKRADFTIIGHWLFKINEQKFFAYPDHNALTDVFLKEQKHLTAREPHYSHGGERYKMVILDHKKQRQSFLQKIIRYILTI